jgi:DNA-binding NarL/FixJ family response regulator
MMEKLVSTGVVGPHEEPGLAELIWVKSNASLASVGLATTLKSEFRVHRGATLPPTASGSPSAVICCLDGCEEQEDVASLVRTTKAEVPEAAVLVLSPSLELQLICAAVSEGARGILHPGAPPGQLARALSVVLRGEMALPRNLLKAWIDWLNEQQRVPDLSALSERKLEILELVAEGLSNAQIARRLYVSESTVKQHLRAAYKLLGAKNRREASSIVWQVQRQVRKKGEGAEVR